MNVAIIQARIGSTRLKNKMLLTLKDSLIIEWVLYRVKKSLLIDKVILAIPNTTANDILEFYANKFNIEVVRGPEDNVLERFKIALDTCGPNIKNILRICADNPLICPKQIDVLINKFNLSDCDYAYNHIPKKNTYPDGLGCEIINLKSFNTIYDNASLQSHKEHCFNYLWDNIEKFNVLTFDPPEIIMCKPHLKFDIDTIEDFNYLNSLNINIDTDSISLLKGIQNEKFI